MPSKLGEYAWFGKNSDFKYQKVGKKKPNPWGLYDMYGNVAEWCLDQYDPDYYKQFANAVADNPWNRATKPYPHAVRGGSWDDDDAAMLRSAARRPSGPLLESAGSAVAQEHLVSLRRAIRRLPHRAPAESSAR